MSIYVRGYAQLRLQLDSQLIAPGHFMELEINGGPSSMAGLDLNIHWHFREAGARLPFFQKVWTPDELTDVYEKLHHQLHGYDARGLDPREGPTRLSTGPRR